MSSPAPLEMTLEFLRVERSEDPFAFRFEAQDYMLRDGAGGYQRAAFPWGQALLEDLQRLQLPAHDPVVAQRLGESLRRFVLQMGWAELESRIHAASRAGQSVFVTIRSAAAELYALPWELLTVTASGEPLGTLPGVHLRYEWPGIQPAASPEGRVDPGRILFAWSAAGGAVPAAEHLAAIEQACSVGGHPFSPQHDVLGNASCRGLQRALTEAQRSGRPIAALHLLCHGAAAEQIFGLALDDEAASSGQALVEPRRLAQLLAPYAATLRLVTLCACDSANSGALGNHLGSGAQTLHRASIEAVVASRYPLSVPGSIALAQTLYFELLVNSSSLENALLSTRRRLLEDAATTDWASLQLYRCAALGLDTRPLLLRPFRGLLPFLPEHRRFLFGRDREIAQVTSTLAALIDRGRPRLLIVAGASGTGKSSLVLAGAVPSMLGSAAFSGWRTTVLRPGREPSSALEAALRRCGTDDVLLVVDQLEELFTLVDDVQERQRFVRALWALAGKKGPGPAILVTLRVDFIGRCGELLLDDGGMRLDRLAYDDGHRVFIAQMGPRELLESITGPAALVGLSLEPGLPERIRDDTGSEPGALPLLQDTLDLLWQRRSGRLLTHAAYDALGGVTGALQGRSTALVDGLSAPDKPVARRLLVGLLNLGDESLPDTRRRRPLFELRPADAKLAESFEHVLTLLVEQRLVVRGEEAGRSTLEIAHEALIRRWPQLRAWAAEGRADSLLERRAGEAARLWDADRRPPGRLWRPPDLDLLADYHDRNLGHLPPLIVEFLSASRREQRRERRQRLLAVVAFVALIAGSSIAYLLRVMAHQSQLLQRLQESHVEAGRQYLLRGEREQGLVWLQQALAEGSTDGALPYLLTAATQSVDALDRVLFGARAPLTAISASADGRYVAAIDFEETAYLWDTGSGKSVVVQSAAPNRSDQDHDEGNFELKPLMSPDGSLLAVVDRDGVGSLFDVPSGARLRTLPVMSGEFVGFAFSQNGAEFAAVRADGSAELWEPRSGVLRAHLDGSPGRTIGEAAFTDNRLLAVSREVDGTARIRDLRSGTIVSTLRGASGELQGVTFSHDRQRLAALVANGSVQIFAVGSGELLSSVTPEAGAPISPQGLRGSLSPDGSVVALPGHHGAVQIFDARRGVLLTRLTGHTDNLSGIIFGRDSSQLLSGSGDATIRSWRLGRGRLLEQASPNQIPLMPSMPDGADSMLLYQGKKGYLLLAAQADSLRAFPLASAAGDSFIGRWVVVSERRNSMGVVDEQEANSTVRVFDTVTSRLLSTITESGRIRQAVFSPDGRRLVTAAESPAISLWDVDTGGKLAMFDGGAPQLSQLSFGRDGRLLLAKGQDGAGWLFDLVDRDVRVHLSAQAKLQDHAAFSADGKWLFVATQDGSGWLWDLAQRSVKTRLSVGGVEHVQFSPGGESLLMNGPQDTARLFTVPGGRLQATLEGRNLLHRGVAFSPTGLRLAAIGEANRPGLWDARSGRLLFLLDEAEPSDFIGYFSSNGQRLVTKSDSMIKLWDVHGDQRSATALAESFRCKVPFRILDGILVPLALDGCSN